jgi:hypothetical protein
MLSTEFPQAPETLPGSALRTCSGMRLSNCGGKTGERPKMNHAMESEMVTIEEVGCNLEGWRSTLGPNQNPGFRTLNARGVEFIAKPGRIRDLRENIRHQVMDYLERGDGFSGALVLTSHKEPRLLLVITFWKTELQARNNCWEHAPAVRKLVGPLPDVCSKVQTYEAALPASPEAETHESNIQAC